MTNFNESREREEDLYAPIGPLSEFKNELQKIMIMDEKIERMGLLRTIEQRNEEMKSDLEKAYEAHPEYREKSYARDEEQRLAMEKIMADHPKKVARINDIVNLLNTTEDVLVCKRATNESLRLLKGEDEELLYTEPEAAPDLLEL